MSKGEKNAGTSLAENMHRGMVMLLVDSSWSVQSKYCRQRTLELAVEGLNDVQQEELRKLLLKFHSV